MATKPTSTTPGWWAVPQNIGNERRWANIPDENVLACIGLWLATTGYCIAYETETINITELGRHLIAGAADTASVLEAAKHLIVAGIWTETVDGIDCGVAHHIQAKAERLERARKGGDARAANARNRQDDPFGEGDRA